MSGFKLNLISCLFCATVCACAIFQSASGENLWSGCDDNCQDYHNHCNPKGDKINLVDCNKDFYKQRCPMKCGVCKKCDLKVDMENTLKQVLSDTVAVQKQLVITSASASSIYQNNRAYCAPEHLFDNNLNTAYKKKSCFHSKGGSASNKQTVQVNFDESHLVKTVKILNRGDCCEKRLNGAEVHVCLGATTPQEQCNKIGTVQNAPKGGWAVLTAPNYGFLGDTVKIINAGIINICEVQVMGY